MNSPNEVTMKKLDDMSIGSIHNTKNGKLRITSYNGCESVGVEFLLTGFSMVTQATNIRRGVVKDYLHPSVCGIGIVGVGVHPVSINRKATKAYQTWRDMIRRCYDPVELIRRPTYSDCTVCPDWHNFQKFAGWFNDNYINGYELDKDIKVLGNRVYSQDTCIFVSQVVNKVAAQAKVYAFVSPLGVRFNIYNLAEFCRVNSLCDSKMCAVDKGHRKHHKGWTKN